ncbi:MAG: glycosyltransferase, partial [Candidatus Omnitrophota bacterium]|nr:glycosyltransferase [Candidatus Omnitrophota bacterium]
MVSLAHARTEPQPSTQKVVVVMPAYNAGRTLRRTYEALPQGRADRVIVVDDAST